MTPLQAAKAYCANYGDSGHCLRMNIPEDGSLYFDPKIPCGRCAIADGYACPYFEQIVLPQCGPGIARRYNLVLAQLGVIKIVRVGDRRQGGKATEFRYLLRPEYKVEPHLNIS